MPEYRHMGSREQHIAAHTRYRIVHPKTWEVLATWDELPGVHSDPPLIREEHAATWDGDYIAPPWILQRYDPPPAEIRWRRVDYRLKPFR